jgi:cobalamin synthase
VFGSLLPWASGPFGISVSATSGDGAITLICGLVVAALAFLFSHKWAAICALLAGLAGTAVGVVDTVNLSGIAGASIGVGLALVDVASLCCVAAAILALGDRRPRTAR